MATSSSLICLSFFLLFTSATCFNITRLLDTYPDFSNFNQYLTQTKLNLEINKRQTITVLAVPNGAMGGVQGSVDVIKNIMSNHVVLDYYDEVKLEKLSKSTALLTTLFQSTGLAEQQQGFLNVTKFKNGDIMFGSAVKGSSLSSKLVKKIAAQPYNISVLEVSAPIIADGIQSAGAPKKAPSPPPAPSPKKAKAPKADAPEADAPVADAPEAETPTTDAPTDAPSDAPTADTPASDAPVAADAPAADAPADADTADAKDKSSATRACVGLALVAISSLIAL